MSDLLYCGTNPVGPDDTQAMLAGAFRAIWSPPMHRHAPVEAGNRLWLLWRAADDDSPLLLGGGVVTATPEGQIDWSNRTAPGIVAEAQERGYRGPTNMAFLRLENVRIPDDRVVVPDLGTIPIGLSAASAEKAAQLNALLRIDSAP